MNVDKECKEKKQCICPSIVKSGDERGESIIDAMGIANANANTRET